MRLVHSKIQILGLVVLSYQVDHKIRVPNTAANRFLVEGMERNRIHYTSNSRLFQMTNFVISATIWNPAGHSARNYVLNPTKSKTLFIYNTFTQTLCTIMKADIKDN